MKSTRAVVFDLGKVLLDFDYSRAIQRLAEAGTRDLRAVRHMLLEDSLLNDYETGEIESADFYARLRNGLGLKLSYGAFREAFADIFTPIPPMIALHGRLRAESISTFVFSNTNEIAIAHIRTVYPFFREFDGHILSYEARAMKPDPRMYAALEQRSARLGGELIYLDDRPENVAAAAQRGWHALLHTDAESSRTALREAGFSV
jgi:glucose-1-phosphatase